MVAEVALRLDRSHFIREQACRVGVNGALFAKIGGSYCSFELEFGDRSRAGTRCDTSVVSSSSIS